MVLQFPMQSWASFLLPLLTTLSKEVSQLSTQTFLECHLKDRGHTDSGKLGLLSTTPPFNIANNSTVVASLCCVGMFTLPLCYIPCYLLFKFQNYGITEHLVSSYYMYEEWTTSIKTFMKLVYINFALICNDFRYLELSWIIVAL